MPVFAWHDRKKQHDFDTSQFLGSSPNTFVDWEVVTLFYSVLHYVDSYLSKAFKIDVVFDHSDRKRLVNFFLPILEKDYRLLYHLGTDARYEQVPMGQNELSKAKTVHAGIKNQLTPVTCINCGYTNLLNRGKCEKCGNIF